ncbi:MAG TPA: aspartyl-phosphate phosphatase Spo0E family protein [Clostridia bacterium]|nr:aspartyl-phosphate phosphatase Spo0E family protein [Clostridia bacterium]
MKDKAQLSKRIEELRVDLETVISEERELIDPKVVKASQSVDKVMTQYYRVSMKRGLGVLKELRV